MARKKPKRKEFLKEPDEFISTTTRLLRFVRRHRKETIISIILLLALAAGGWGWKSYRESMEEEAYEAYLQAYHLFRNISDQGKTKKAHEGYQKVVEKFQEVVDRYPRTRAARFASLYKGHSCYQLGRFDDAISAYRFVVEGTEGELRALALYGLAYSYMAKGEYGEAVKGFKKWVEVGGDGFKELGDLNIAMCYEDMGKEREALAIYKRLQDKLESPLYRLLIEDKIQRLSSSRG